MTEPPIPRPICDHCGNAELAEVTLRDPAKPFRFAVYQCQRCRQLFWVNAPQT